jgi:hypothetical protein
VPYEAGKLYAALVKGEGVGCEVYIYPESDHRLADSVETGVDVVVKSVVWMEEGRVASGEGKEEVKEESKEVKGDIKEEVKK